MIFRCTVYICCYSCRDSWWSREGKEGESQRSHTTQSAQGQADDTGRKRRHTRVCWRVFCLVCYYQIYTIVP